MKVLILGDSPYGKTGFGRVNYHAVKGFLDAGLEVAAVSALITEGEKQIEEPDPRVKLFIPEDKDVMGLTIGRKAIDEWQPDVIYATGDPGNLTAFSTILPTNIPLYAYIPIEGEPLINRDWRELLNYIDFMTCSQYGAEVAMNSLHKPVDYIYHGVEEAFTPMDDAERATFRERLGWSDKFVIACVAQNVRRKQLPRLIEAVAILKRQYKQSDIVLYLHTVPFQGYYLDGWRLPDITEAYGVTREVFFNPLMGRKWAAVPESGTLDVPGLRELVGSADLFVLPSEVEGFGLPIAEAMAVGTPVMVTKYAAGWEVARQGQGVGIPVVDWEVHKSGTRYAHVDPQVMAKEILRLKRNPKQRARMREAGIEAAKLFDWTVFEKEIAERVINAAQKKEAPAQAETSGPAYGTEDSTADQVTPSLDLREDS